MTCHSASYRQCGLHRTRTADLEKLLKNEGYMPEDKFLVMSRKGKRLGVAFASTPRGERRSSVPEIQN